MYDNLLAHVPTDLWIDGKWRKASDDARFDVIDPATENVVTSVASASVEDAMMAVDAAHNALEGWAGRKPREHHEDLRLAMVLVIERPEIRQHAGKLPQRQPKRRIGIPIEQHSLISFRHHSHDGERHAINPDGRAQDGGIAAEASFPNRKTCQGCRRSAV